MNWYQTTFSKIKLHKFHSNINTYTNYHKIKSYWIYVYCPMGNAHSDVYAKSPNGPKIALGQFWLLKWAACAIDCSPPDHHNVNARIIQFNLLLAFSAMCSTLHFEIKHQDQEPRTQSCANKTCSWGKGVRGSNLSNKEMQSKQGSHPERMLVSDRIGSLLSFLWHWWHTIEIHFTCTCHTDSLG